MKKFIVAFLCIGFLFIGCQERNSSSDKIQAKQTEELLSEASEKLDYQIFLIFNNVNC